MPAEVKRSTVLVGCGRWGVNVARVLNRTGRLVAVYDPAIKSKAMLKTLLNQDVVVCASLDAALSFGDRVFLATPAESHLALGLRVIEAGSHLLVEKPMAMTMDGAVALARAATVERDQVLMVGHLFRYHPMFVKVRELVDHDRLGPLEYIRSTQTAPGQVRERENVVLSLAPHDLSMVLALGGEVDRVRAHRAPSGGHAFSASIQLSMGRLQADIYVCWMSPEKRRDLLVVGERAAAHADFVTGELHVFDRQPGRQPFCSHTQPVEYERIEYPEAEPLEVELAHWHHLCDHWEADHVAMGAVVDRDLRAALAVMKVADEAAETQWNGV